jgi:hypothetical protein
MASPCNSLNVQTIKVSQLNSISRTIKPSDSFLVIQNDTPTKSSRKATFANLLTFLSTVSSGSYSGSFTGSARGHFTGSFTGSFKGRMSASNAFTNKVAFHGTSSWAANANRALTADAIVGSPAGVADQFTYWTGLNTLGSTTYLTIASTNNKSLLNLPGRIMVNRPFDFGNTANSVMPQIIQYSQSYELYEIGMQYANNYIRTGKNFAIFYSGSYNIGALAATGKEAIWSPDTSAKIGKSGWTVVGVRQRLFGIGHFSKTDQVNAQCHVHLSSSFGWPEGYDPNANVWLVTSGSNFTKLARLTGTGQLDVKGDIVAYSTFASSDARLKNDIQPIEYGYDKLSNLNPVSFTWESNDQPDFGLIAQEVEELYPEFVKEDMNGYRAVKYNSFIPLLIKTVQEQQHQIFDLLKRVESLESE